MTEITPNTVQGSQVNQESLEQTTSVEHEIKVSVTAIEEAAKRIGSVLDEASKTAVRRGRPKGKKDDGALELEKAIRALADSPWLAKVGEHEISQYWRHDTVCGELFKSWKVKDFVHISASEIAKMKGVGHVRVSGLVDALRYAAAGKKLNYGATPEIEYDYTRWMSKVSVEVQKDVNFIFEEGAGVRDDTLVMPRVLRQIPRQIGPQPVCMAWGSRNVFHRRFADQLGITESRVSQILTIFQECVRSVIKTEAPEMYASWQKLLSQPAASEEQFFSPWLNFGLDPQRRRELGLLLLECFNAKVPEVPTGFIEGYWSSDANRLRDFALQMSEKLPMTDREMKAYLQQHAPALALAPTEILKKSMGRSAEHLKNPGVWFKDRHQALDYVLRQANGRPLTRHEIAAALGVKPTQTKELLLRHPNLERMGCNLQRTYRLLPRDNKPVGEVPQVFTEDKVQEG